MLLLSLYSNCLNSMHQRVQVAELSRTFTAKPPEPAAFASRLGLFSSTITLSANSAGGSGWSNIISMIAQLFFILIAFGLVLMLAIYATKWLSSARYIKRANQNLKIVESLNLGYQNGIHLVKAGKKYILLGITKDKITYLTELSEEDVMVEEREEVKNFPGFEKYLTQFIQKMQLGKDDDSE